MKISFVSFDAHNQATDDNLSANLHEINGRTVFILFGAGDAASFKKMALEQSGLKLSQQGVWVAPLEHLDLKALKAAFPLIELDNTQRMDSVVHTKNHFLNVLQRRAVDIEVAPGIRAMEYRGNLPPAGENLLGWFRDNGTQLNSRIATAPFDEHLHATLERLNTPGQVRLLFHSPDFHAKHDALLEDERAVFAGAQVGGVLEQDGKLVIKLSERIFAPAVETPMGLRALPDYTAASPQAALRATPADILENRVATLEALSAEPESSSEVHHEAELATEGPALHESPATATEESSLDFDAIVDEAQLPPSRSTDPVASKTADPSETDTAETSSVEAPEQEIVDVTLESEFDQGEADTSEPEESPIQTPQPGHDDTAGIDSETVIEATEAYSPSAQYQSYFDWIEDNPVMALQPGFRDQVAMDERLTTEETDGLLTLLDELQSEQKPSKPETSAQNGSVAEFDSVDASLVKHDQEAPAEPAEHDRPAGSVQTGPDQWEVPQPGEFSIFNQIDILVDFDADGRAVIKVHDEHRIESMFVTVSRFEALVSLYNQGESLITRDQWDDATAAAEGRPVQSEDQQGQSAPTTVLQLHPQRKVPEVELDTKAIDEMVSQAEQAGVSMDEIRNLAIQYVELDRERERMGNVTSLKTRRMEAGVMDAFKALQEKALQGGLVLSENGFFQMVNRLNGYLSEVIDIDPWKASEDTLQSINDVLFFDMLSRVPETSTVERALMEAKRRGFKVGIRILENALEHGLSDQASHMANQLCTELNTSERIFALKTQIHGLLAGAHEQHLGTNDSRVLSVWREELAELEYQVSEIELTDTLKSIYRDAGSYTESCEAIAEHLSISESAAGYLIDRIRDQLQREQEEAFTNSPEYQLSQKILAKLDGFVPDTNEERSAIALRNVGPYTLLVPVAEISDSGEVRMDLYLSDTGRYARSSEQFTVTGQINDESLVDNLAAEINAVAQKHETLTKMDKLPPYGSLLKTGENGSTLHDVSEINRRLRETIKSAQSSGELPKGVKVSITKGSSSSISIRVTGLPEGMQAVSEEWAQWRKDNPDESSYHAPHIYIPEFRAIERWLTAQAEAYNYDKSDRQSDYYNTNFYLNVSLGDTLHNEHMAMANEAIEKAQPEVAEDEQNNSNSESFTVADPAPDELPGIPVSDSPSTPATDPAPWAVLSDSTLEDTQTAVEDAPVVDWESISAAQFKKELDRLSDHDATMMLAYRFGHGRPLETCKELDLVVQSGQATQRELAIFGSMRQLFTKHLDDAILKEQQDGERTNRLSQPSPNGPDNLQATDTGADRSFEQGRQHDNLVENERDHDRQEAGSVRDRLPTTEPKAGNKRLPTAGELGSEAATISGGSTYRADESDTVTLPIAPLREVNFDPSESLKSLESLSDSEIRNRLTAAILVYVGLKKDDIEPNDAQRQMLAALSGTGSPAITTVLSGRYPDTSAMELSKAFSALQAVDSAAANGIRASTVDSYYTSTTVIDFMYSALDKLGMNDLKHRLHITEPSVGNGRFVGLAPKALREHAEITAVEKDPFAATLTSWLYPEARVYNSGFEDVVLPRQSQDLVVGNPPYGDFTVYDPQDKRQRLVHDYFLKRSIELAKPGGIVAFVTSSGTMDKKNASIRKQVAASSDLVAGFRLPADTFKSEGAEVVTDILFFRKRHPGELQGDTTWVNTETLVYPDPNADEDAEPITKEINSYFASNPDRILGEVTWKEGRFGPGLSVSGSHKDIDWDALLNMVPAGAMNPHEHPGHAREDQTRQLVDPRFADNKIGSYVVTDTTLAILEANGLRPIEVSKSAQTKMPRLIAVRDALLQLLDAENQNDVPAAEAARETLNARYDEFVKHHGYLNGRGNKNLLKRDPDQYLVLALEKGNADTGAYSKADIFTTPLTQINVGASSDVTNIEDGIAFSMNVRGFVDASLLADTLNLTVSEVEEQLQPHCFKQPETGRWEIKALYLSGNIYEKLEIAERAAKQDPSLERNVKALNEAVPEAIGIDEIHIRLGANWIPPETVRDFVACTLTEGNPLNINGEIQLTHVPVTNHWDLRLTGRGKSICHSANTLEHGTREFTFAKLVDLALNLKRPTVNNPNGTIDHEATQLARSRQNEIIREFADFVKDSSFHSSRLQDAYNRTFNSFREAQYDGSYLTFPGMTGVLKGRPLKLHDHQPAVVERIITSNRGVLIAHEAGAGKTIEMIASAMELRRLGVANRPLVVIPNHMLQQATNEARDLYPGARILTATPEDFTAEGRAVFANKVRMNQWDMVICTHNMFASMALQDEFIQQQIEDELDEYRGALVSTNSQDRIAIRNLETSIKKLEAKLKQVTAKAKDNYDENVISFAECGFDGLFYDEGHYLKNYAPPTSLSGVAGVNSVTSGRAQDAVMKADFIRQSRGDQKGVYLATGTPITNSVTEIWVMLRITAPQTLRDLGLYQFDAFAANFCEVVEHVELKPEGGGYQIKERLSRFHNVPEMIRIFRSVADIKTGDDLKLPKPGRNDVKHVAKQSSMMKKFMDWLGHRAQLVRNQDKEPWEDNLLSISNAGRLGSLDLRLIDEDLPDDPNSKVNQCIANVLGKWKEHESDRRTQLIFLDRGTPKKGFNLYDDIKNKLIAQGVPADEIAFIHDAKNPTQKEALFERVRNGEVRILLASTDKAGVGTNVQTRGSDLHMLDVPWRPTDLEQRIKRFERQGNLFDNVNIHYYTTEDSFDLFMLETVIRKLKFITQAMSNPDKAARSMDEDVEPTLAEIMAITTGNPIIRDKVEIDMQVEQAELQRRGHISKVRNARSTANQIRDMVMPSWEEEKVALTKAIDAGIPERFEMIVGDSKMDNPKQAGLRIHSMLAGGFIGETQLGSIQGYPVVAVLKNDKIHVQWNGPVRCSTPLTKGPEIFTTNLIKKIQEMPMRLETVNNQLTSLNHELDTALEIVKAPYQKQDELDALLAKQTEINIEVRKLEDSMPPADKSVIHEFEEILNQLEVNRNLESQVLTQEEIDAANEAIDRQKQMEQTMSLGV
ncbi:helicase-related protein [Marinobacterium stanieri]|uniref:Adenine-specific DNA methylase, N12 class n=1 Tax=Marinobacterium stanieri TaxID=49186 RepID=A0A1N6XA44_9GAMM|nr:helicase-related protein [Marinobacterium stanieri]SIQ99222.1 Adenine-specific DNA methylase, N12 class [Marinobacterium stanieri]